MRNLATVVALVLALCGCRHDPNLEGLASPATKGGRCDAEAGTQLASIPLQIAQSIAVLPAGKVTVRIDGNGNAEQLLEAEKQLLAAERNLMRRIERKERRQIRTPPCRRP